MGEKKLQKDMIDSTAKLFLAVFSQKYNTKFEKMLVGGGGGNSMFVNAWDKPARYFMKKRISREATKRLKNNGYTPENIPHKFLRHNAKGSKNRKAHGKELHEDHNPGNVRVLHLIKNRVRNYGKDMIYSGKLQDLTDFIKVVQTLDIITVEQDDKRTYGDGNYTKQQKNMMTARKRDSLLKDRWKELD